MNNKALFRKILLTAIIVIVVTGIIAYIKFNKDNSANTDYNSTSAPEEISIIQEPSLNTTNMSNLISQNDSISYANLSEEINSSSQ